MGDNLWGRKSPRWCLGWLFRGFGFLSGGSKDVTDTLFLYFIMVGSFTFSFFLLRKISFFVVKKIKKL